VTFISNDRLAAAMARTSATPEQVKAAAQVNADARLRALKLTFLMLSLIALLMIVPVRMLPAFRRGELPPGPQPQDKPA